MSRKYKKSEAVPTETLCDRADELAHAVTLGGMGIMREFDMRIPVELDRDADVVISEMAKRLGHYVKREKEQQEAVNLDALNDELKWILGRPCFTVGGTAQALIKAGLYEGRRKAEDEQAIAIHWMLKLYLKHGNNWRDEGDKILKAMQDKLKESTEP